MTSLHSVTTRLHLAQLITLLTATETEPLFEQASRHLTGEATYVSGGEESCAVTGHLFTVTPEGTAIRGLLDGLRRDGVRLTAAQFNAEFDGLLLDRLDRWSLGDTPEDMVKGTMMAHLIDTTAVAALRQGLATPRHWTWWDADLVDVPPESSDWLIRRADDGGTFGSPGRTGQATYLCSARGNEIWVTQVDADITTVRQAQAALARRTLRA
ncbi:hypothetical protein [Deinococcus aerolatus]|nr:hypothetical protein [Deinococcus aerolatus]